MELWDLRRGSTARPKKGRGGREKQGETEGRRAVQERGDIASKQQDSLLLDRLQQARDSNRKKG